MLHFQHLDWSEFNRQPRVAQAGRPWFRCAHLHARQRLSTWETTETRLQAVGDFNFYSNGEECTYSENNLCTSCSDIAKNQWMGDALPPESHQSSVYSISKVSDYLCANLHVRHLLKVVPRS
jgi:hypothetical protein